LINNTSNEATTLRGVEAKHFVLGVVGHVDHGKTALVRALSGEDTDRLAEEKRRGISIALGFARLKVGNTEIDLIDMPGHERFVRTMISGATGIDAVLLVVAANEGIQPQTVEHVDIAALLGLARGVVAISKADLVDPMEARRVADDAMRLLIRSGLEPAPPVVTSALHGEGIEELRGRLKDLAAGQLARAADGVAFLPIDRAFSIAGHGPVVTGTLRGAAVAVGDMLELLPPRRGVRVRAVQVHGERVMSAAPGQRVALNLRDIEIAELERGMALAAPDELLLSNWLTISIRALPDAQPLTNGMRLRAMLGTDEKGVRLRLLDRNVLEAGQSAFAQLHSAEPVALPAREPVVLRVPSPPRTVAGGRVLEPGARRAQRLNPRILQRLEDLCALPPAAIVAAEVEHSGPAGTTLRSLAQLLALPAPRIVELLRTLPLIVTRSGAVLRKADVNSLLARIPAALARHTALSRDQLLEAAATGGEVLDEALRVLLARGMISKRGSEFLVPRPQEDRARAREEADLAARIAEVLRRGGLSPPTPGTIVTDARSNRAVERLLREGVIVRALDADKRKEILFHREAIEDAKRRLAPLLERPPGMLVTEIGAQLGISRKFTMPLLGHLDTIRFTRRVKDRRVRA
jgi:selenocysteine-specific elongation factor